MNSFGFRLSAFALLYAFTPVRLSAQSPAWNVDSARGPEKILEFAATEGTWISVDVSPDGRMIAFDLLGHLYEMPFAGGDARVLTRGRSWNHLPRYSPDGTKIMFTSDRRGKEGIWLLHRGNDSLEALSKGDERTFQGSWTADGRGYYAVTGDMGARFGASRFDLYGSRQVLAQPQVFTPPAQIIEDSARKRLIFAQPAGPVYGNAFQLKTYDLATGEVQVLVSRRGGAASPVISRDGKWLAYVHRDDQETVLILRELATGMERVLQRGLDRDRQEPGAGTTYGAYPTMAWHPSGQEIVAFWGGKLHAVNVTTGAARDIPFRAPVRRELTQTIRFPVPQPVSGKATTRSHRFGVRTDRGVVYEALGDLWLKDGTASTNLTRSAATENSPAYDPATRTLYYATWTDDSLGAVWARPIDGSAAARRVTTVPSQYGSLTLSPDGRTLAFLRGGDDLRRGQTLEGQGRFDLIVVGPDRAEKRVTSVEWGEGQYANFATKHPPGITFAPDGSQLYFTEMLADTLFVKRIRTDGLDEKTLYKLPHSVRAVVSPDLRWIAFREYTRTFVTPLDYIGKVVSISPFDNQGVTFRVDSLDGDYFGWTRDSKGLEWTRGTSFYEKSVDDIVAKRGAARATGLAVEYEVAVPQGVIALTNARVITMDGTRRVLENATIIVRNNRIESVGTGIAAPSGAHVVNLAGKTVMPGIIDAHAHYNPDISTLNVVEQQHQGMIANLAYGVTTLYEVYGNDHKDFLVSDMQRAGTVWGPRLLSTGWPIYGQRFYRPKLYRPIITQADADEVVRLNREEGATALKDYAQFNRMTRQALYAAARKQGVNVVAETAVDPAMNWTMLIDGVSGLEHTVGLTPLYDDVIRLWGATGAGNTPTLIVVYNGPAGELYFHQRDRLWEDRKLLNFNNRDDLLAFRRPTKYFDDDVYAGDMAAELRKLHKAGVSIQVSGHGQMHGLDKHWEMELMGRGGFTPAEILGFATIQGAKYLNLDTQLGSIEAGKFADLVILGANPLDDIKNTRSIEQVMQNGVLYSGNDAARIWPNPAPAPKLYFKR
jgi:Tol biopolymer transport system component